MNQPKYLIPQLLDMPFKIILWTVDESLIFLMPFLIFMLGFNSPLTGVVIGGLLMIGLKHLKGVQGQGFVYSLLYWHLPPIFLLYKTPPSHIRAWLG